MPEDRPSVAVVGAAGFVGRELLRQLADDGIRATAITRGMPELVVADDEHDVGSPAGLAGTRFDVVVNLAYPTAGPPYNYPDANAAIVDSVDALLAPSGHLIHASSLAVFGFALDRPIVHGPVARVRDEAYVEAKIEAEHAFAKLTEQRGLRTDVLRFGNVCGRASPGWALGLSHKLLTGRPVGVESGYGYSNATDVANAAAYVRFLAFGQPRAAGVRYHHVAEFADVRWDAWLLPFAEALGVEPVLAPDELLERPTTARGELREGLAELHPRRLGRALSRDRLLGSWERSALRLLPATTRDDVKGRAVYAAPEPATRLDQTLLAIMAPQQLFAPRFDEGWTPPVTLEDSVAAAVAWLEGE